MVDYGGRALNGLGLLQGYQTQPNSECHNPKCGRQTASDKIRSREGKSPDHQLRSLKCAKWERMWVHTDSQEVGLEAAIL